VIARIQALLDRLGVQYAVIGAMAMAARGYPRFTLDFDFLTTNKEVLNRDAWNALIEGGTVVEVRKGEFDDPLAGVVRVGNPAEVDVIVGKWKWEQRVVDDAELLQVAGLMLPVARASDLVLMKLNAGGIKGRLDVISMLEHCPREQLIAEVESKLGDLPSTAEKEARAIWQEILAER